VATAQRRVVLWQIPMGNTLMRFLQQLLVALPEQHGRVAARRPDARHITGYADAGVVAFLFGAGAGGCTVAGDAASDGVTNPAVIAANTYSTNASPTTSRPYPGRGFGAGLQFGSQDPD